MTYAVRALQARCAALGFFPGPIDGVRGRRTEAAYAAACEAQRAKGLPFQHPSGLTRIHLHWSAGAYTANALDRQHYHILIDGEGSVIEAHPPTAKLAHTLNANGGAIGIAVCAMAGAVERPWRAGAYPVKALQLAAMAQAAKRLCVAYDIPVSRYSVLGHAEVQPTLGVKQKGKIDFVWISGMAGPEDPISVGDRLRGMIERVVL